MVLDEAGLDEYTDRFIRDAFRHEILPRYQVPTDGGDLARYLAGEPRPNPAVVEPWGHWVRKQRARGATVRRLRTLVAPPSAYLRWEMEWVYSANAAAGEEIRILDLTEGFAPVGLLMKVEYWMLDHDRLAVLDYDGDGRFLRAYTWEDATASAVREARDQAWDIAEPFDSWWARHPQYHRASA